MSEPIFVFVYGTLRAGQSNDINRFVPPPIWVGEGQVRGVLYDLGPYPGLLLVDTSVQRVTGEIYRISEALLEQLDVLEEIIPSQDSEYFRKSIAVQCGHSQVCCWVYEINRNRIEMKKEVPGGDWCLFQSGSAHGAVVEPDGRV